MFSGSYALLKKNERLNYLIKNVRVVGTPQVVVCIRRMNYQERRPLKGMSAYGT